MLKTRVVALAAALLACVSVHAQSAADGRVVGSAYVNSYFHLSYAWPAPLKVVPQPAAREDPKAFFLPLFTAQAPGQPYGVVLVAEKLGVPGPHSTGVKSSAEFVDRIAHSLRTGTILSNITRSEKKNARGIVFEELGYLQSGNHALLMATQVDGYVLVFKCNAPTGPAIAGIEKSVLAARLGK